LEIALSQAETENLIPPEWWILFSKNPRQSISAILRLEQNWAKDPDFQG
jgi:hypothetical protein